MAAPRPEKLRHLAICLPLVGLFLLMPPALYILSMTITVFGIPLVVVYIFGVWGGLIASAAVLARYLDTRDIVEPAARPGSVLGEHQPARSTFGSDRAG